MSATPVKAWICSVCGYIHYGDEPPAECPVCGAEQDLFDPYFEPAPVAAQPPAAGPVRKIVIVGAGIAGVSAAEAARRADPHASILLLSAETGLPYYRMSLTRYLAGELDAAQLPLHPADWYSGSSIEFRRGTPVAALNLAEKSLSLADGSRISYDSLVLTVGAGPFRPPIPGADLPGVTTLRTLADADAILAACRPKTPVMCIGGGLLGLETAGALAHRGAAVTVLENQAWLLPRQLNQSAAHLFQEKIHALNIAVINSASVRAIRGGPAVAAVELQDGAVLPAALVIVSAGVRPRLDLARAAGLDINQGVRVDDHLRTSHRDVFAAGDVAEHNGMLYGTWSPAQSQGAVAGANAAGQEIVFASLPRAATLKVLGIDLFSVGHITPPPEGGHLIAEESGGNYTGLIFHQGFLVGAILLGGGAYTAPVRQAVEQRRDFTALLASDPTAAEILHALA